jgi:uncharacterized protein with HEPN domain
MPPDPLRADRIRFEHMIEAAQQALGFAAARSRELLETDLMFRRAIIHCIQEIGEAAVRLTPESRALAPSIPWNQIVGMRHRLVHVYFEIDLNLVWQVVTQDLPVLVAAVAGVLDQSADGGKPEPPTASEAD